MSTTRKERTAKSNKVTVGGSTVEKEQELARLMDTYNEMTNPWVLSTLHLPLFPYWRDINVRSPNVDVVDYGDRYSVTVELPGYDKEDVDVTVNGFSVEITARQDLEEKSIRSRNYVQRERLHSSYQRTIQFPQEVTPANAKAVLKNGLLEMEIPKIENLREKSRRVSIE